MPLTDPRDIEDLVGRDADVNARAVRAITTEDERDGPEKLVVLAEFGGPRVSCSREVQHRVQALVRAQTDWHGEVIVEIVRGGWLSGAEPESAVVDPDEARRRYTRLEMRRRDTTLVFNTTFEMNITEDEKDAFEYFGSLSKIRTPTNVAHPRLIHLGNWVSLGRFGKIYMQTDFSGLPPLVRQHYPEARYDVPAHLFEPRTPRLKLGDGTTIGDNFFINCNLDISTGWHVGIADRCYISDANHLHDMPDVPPSLMPNEIGKPIRIDDHCWLGINAVVINGAHIGKHSIVSSNSVVSTSMPPYSLAVGNPARVVPFTSMGLDRR
jgi:acetyltransferase-like isoleucine patch superfamily enzyme